MVSGRTALAAVRALAAAGYEPTVTSTCKATLASSSRWCRRAVPVPRTDGSGWLDAVCQELRSGAYLGVLPTSDVALATLELPGVSLLDKREVHRRARAAGLAAPDQWVFGSPAQLREAAADLPFPVVAKPVVRRPGRTRNAVRLDSPAQLSSIPDDAGELVVQPFLRGRMRAVAGVLHEGRLLAAVHQRYIRIWPRDCGVASAAETVAPDLELEARLPDLLQGHEGVFQVQLVGTQVIDVNPRVYGSLPLAVAAGANLPGIWCDAMDGRAPARLVRGRAGVPYRWLDADLRAVAGAVADRELSPIQGLRAVRPRRGTAHSIISVRDPRPALLRLAFALRSPEW
jgi:predicted ATP-grasp superfamily ATP-dependent carboligase